MKQETLSENLRLLCSYGRSTSDICRRAKINRQQFNKYLNGHASPSLATLRKICDFFGVEEHEIFLDVESFKQLIKLRPPRIGKEADKFEKMVDEVFAPKEENRDFFERHEGYYHAYIIPDPARGHCMRSLSRIYQENGKWFAKTIERQMDEVFMLPSTLKYHGIVMEGCNRIAIYEREQSKGRGLNATFLYPTERSEPTYLSGLLMAFASEGTQEITCIRTVWQYLGKEPDLRQALQQCGPVNLETEPLPEFISRGIDNSMLPSETVFSPRF